MEKLDTSFNGEQGKIRQFMVTTIEDKIVAMFLTREEAVAKSKENEFYYVGNMYNHFSNHDCKLSPDSGCKICELLASIK